MSAKHALAGADYRGALGVWTACCLCGHRINGPTRHLAEGRIRNHAASSNHAEAKPAEATEISSDAT